MYVDSDIIYALLRPEDRLRELARRIIQRDKKIYTSIITVLELQLVAKREISEIYSQKMLEEIKAILPDLVFKEYTQDTINKSSFLRKKYGLGIFDSIHAATSFMNDKLIAYTDHIYDRINGLERVAK